MIAVTCFLLAFRIWTLHGHLPHFSAQDNPASFAELLQTRILTYCYLLYFNVQLLLYPVTLCYDWQMGSIPLVEGMGDWRNISTLLFLVCLAVLVIEYVKSLPHHMVIADFGCGEARLAQSVLHTVHSFDLVACNSYVTACNMAHVPLPSASVDVCVFCLSLMGTNITDFIKEGKRVLKQDGRLKICDVASRFTSVENFAKDVESFGFKLFKTRTLSKMFVDLEFKVTSQVRLSKLPNIQLKPCCYKRR